MLLLGKTGGNIVPPSLRALRGYILREQIPMAHLGGVLFSIREASIILASIVGLLATARDASALWIRFGYSGVDAAQ